jgi:hypothetical protein
LYVAIFTSASPEPASRLSFRASIGGPRDITEAVNVETNEARGGAISHEYSTRAN